VVELERVNDVVDGVEFPHIWKLLKLRDEHSFHSFPFRIMSSVELSVVPVTSRKRTREPKPKKEKKKDDDTKEMTRLMEIIVDEILKQRYTMVGKSLRFTIAAFKDSEEMKPMIVPKPELNEADRMLYKNADWYKLFQSQKYRAAWAQLGVVINPKPKGFSGNAGGVYPFVQWVEHMDYHNKMRTLSRTDFGTTFFTFTMTPN
jgi:hypothetical protein